MIAGPRRFADFAESTWGRPAMPGVDRSSGEGGRVCPPQGWNTVFLETKFRLSGFIWKSHFPALVHLERECGTLVADVSMNDVALDGENTAAVAVLDGGFHRCGPSVEGLIHPDTAIKRLFGPWLYAPRWTLLPKFLQAKFSGPIIEFNAPDNSLCMRFTP